MYFEEHSEHFVNRFLHKNNLVEINTNPIVLPLLYYDTTKCMFILNS